jgi:hypothetical protein
MQNSHRPILPNGPENNVNDFGVVGPLGTYGPFLQLFSFFWNFSFFTLFSSVLFYPPKVQKEEKRKEREMVKPWTIGRTMLFPWSRSSGSSLEVS